MPKISDFYKIRVAVPRSAADAVKQAIAQAGGARQGNYVYCFGSLQQTGEFRPQEGSHPAIGQVGKTEYVEEILIEALCPSDKLSDAVDAIRNVHPYEEPAIDVIQRFEA